MEVLESAPNGTVLFHLNASDADVLEENSALAYHLMRDPGNADTFSVEEKTGEVILIWKLDYERRKTYFMGVEARDRGGHVCNYNLRVHVLDVNDNPPTFELPIKISSVPENAPVGSIIGKIHATDPDSGGGFLS